MADPVLIALARTIHSGRVVGLRGIEVERWPDEDPDGRLVVIYDERVIEIDATVRGYVEPTDGC